MPERRSPTRPGPIWKSSSGERLRYSRGAGANVALNLMLPEPDDFPIECAQSAKVPLITLLVRPKFIAPEGRELPFPRGQPPAVPEIPLHEHQILAVLALVRGDAGEEINSASRLHAAYGFRRDRTCYFAATPASGCAETICQTVFWIVTASAGSIRPYGAVSRPTGDCLSSVAK